MGRSFPEGEWDDGDASDNSSSCETAHTVYTAELIVFDNNKHCLLTDGDYELALHEKHKRPGRKKGILSNRTSWENVFEGQVSSREGNFTYNAWGQKKARAWLGGQKTWSITGYSPPREQRSDCKRCFRRKICVPLSLTILTWNLCTSKPCSFFHRWVHLRCSPTVPL